MIKRLFSAAVLTAFLVAEITAQAPTQALAANTVHTITASGAGIYPSGATFNGIQLAGGTFGIGAKTYDDGSAIGDLELQLNGSNVVGLSQWITITGWITTGTVNPDGSATLNGTGTLDMGDGAAPTTGLPLVATLTISGVQVTIGTTAVPSLPKSDGFISIE